MAVLHSKKFKQNHIQKHNIVDGGVQERRRAAHTVVGVTPQSVEWRATAWNVAFERTAQTPAHTHARTIVVLIFLAIIKVSSNATLTAISQ